MMSKYRKGIAALIGGLAATIFALWGQDLGLPADWPETTAAMLTPIAVYFIPNESA